jgi:hypothetical protein
MDLLEFLVIAIIATVICLRQACISMLQDYEAPPTASRRRRHPRPQQAGPIPRPANDTWSVRKAA